MLEDNVLKFVPLSSCICRDDEIASMKADKQILSIEDSKVVIKPHQKEYSADVSSEFKVMNAFTRRSLAMDQAGLVPFTASERIARTFMSKLSQATPPGYSAPSLQQVLAADRELWTRAIEKARQSFKPDAAGLKPLDDLLFDLSTSASVIFHLLPLPSTKHSSTKPLASQKRDVKQGPESSRPNQQALKKRRQSGPAMPRPLKDFQPSTKSGERVCYAFNLAHGCDHIASGNPPKCSKGLRICIRCHKPGHAAPTCH